MYSKQLCRNLLKFQYAQHQNGLKPSERLPLGTIWDVFFLSSDSKSDRSIVNQLKTILHKEGARVGSRDNFISGISGSIVENTLLSILSSVTVVALISQDFIEDETCRLSLRSACNYKLVYSEKYKGMIIPVVCSTLEFNNIPYELHTVQAIFLGNNPVETVDDWLPDIKRSMRYARTTYHEDWFQAYQFLKELPQNQVQNLITALTNKLSFDVQNCQFDIAFDIMKDKPKDMQLRFIITLLNAIDMGDTTVHIVKRDVFENNDSYKILYGGKNQSDIEIIKGAKCTCGKKYTEIHIIAAIVVTALLTLTGRACSSFLLHVWNRKRQ